jgi:hypothetical protein
MNRGRGRLVRSMTNAARAPTRPTAKYARSLGRWASWVGLFTALEGGLFIAITVALVALEMFGPGNGWRAVAALLGGAALSASLVWQGMSLHDAARNFRLLADTGDPRMISVAISRVGRYFVVDAWLLLTPVALVLLGLGVAAVWGVLS